MRYLRTSNVRDRRIYIRNNERRSLNELNIVTMNKLRLRGFPKPVSFVREILPPLSRDDVRTDFDPVKDVTRVLDMCEDNTCVELTYQASMYRRFVSTS